MPTDPDDLVIRQVREQLAAAVASRVDLYEFLEWLESVSRNRHRLMSPSLFDLVSSIDRVASEADNIGADPSELRSQLADILRRTSRADAAEARLAQVTPEKAEA